ncbi:ribosomal oxygenase 1-like [Actinia tenebrosa]|uniref:Bifunctional lysine-specific demethylase and histidyl-hydroxylase n=1 Tax=Actinia tenebrosa TaxID=6105 RepID=A0A6P8IZR1_ACTTE|nr:ribosomal oxygenase 1-like [Actinia tenebrosa]
MLPNKRRSAYDVYRENATKNAESGLKNDDESESTQEEIVTKDMPKTTSASKRRSSKKAGNISKSSQNASTEKLESKSHGHRILSKANKLRRSLHMSGKKKSKRASSMASSAANKDTEKENEDSESETPIPKKKSRGESENTSYVKITNDGASSSAGPFSSSAIPRSRPVNTYSSCSIGSTISMLEGQAETEAEKLMKWLISPVKPKKFFSELWERKPLLIKRHQPAYNEGWFSTAELDEILRKHNIRFSVNVDVTTYKDGKRETHNPSGRAYAPVVWDFYQNDCSVRLLNPQSFSQSVWKLTSLLQEYFGCFVGANIYLTPPGSQGFAPHYDDIEAFIIQLEGKKHWRLYNPRSEEESLPRYSSGNFSQDEIGEPILDTVLEPGDVVYFPRGTIHQADTPSDSHSLHITLSTYQKNSWGDFFQKLVPAALQAAFDEDPEFRQGLPLNYLDYIGVANSDTITKERSEFLRKVEKLMSKLVTYSPVDAAADQMAIGVISDCLPPVLNKDEINQSIIGSGATWDGNKVVSTATITSETHVRLIRKGIARLVSEEDSVCVYHTMENSRIYHEVEPQKLEFNPEAGPAIESILNAFPDYVKVDDLPHESTEFKVDMVTMLYEKGLLLLKDPLEP